MQIICCYISIHIEQSSKQRAPLQIYLPVISSKAAQSHTFKGLKKAESKTFEAGGWAPQRIHWIYSTNSLSPHTRNKESPFTPKRNSVLSIQLSCSSGWHLYQPTLAGVQALTYCSAIFIRVTSACFILIFWILYLYVFFLYSVRCYKCVVSVWMFGVSEEIC